MGRREKIIPMEDTKKIDNKKKEADTKREAAIQKMTWKEVEGYLEKLQAYGSVPGLDNIKNLCEKLENPQNDLCFVHIAGTNGKGSVLACLSTVLKEAGYRTGSYLSPTVLDYRERIQINGKMISKKDLCEEFSLLRAACEELVSEGKPHPTPFEIETAMAFHYFKDRSCDIVVLETGLGGAADATNIIEHTAAAVFTSISMDHMGILGNTMEKIAKQKAGIIKKGCTAVVIRQQPEAEEILKQECERQQAVFLQADPDLAKEKKCTLEKQVFSYKEYKNLEITMTGRYQIANAVLAVEAIRVLGEKGFPVKEEALRKGLLTAFMPGRFQVISKKPTVIADGAHNADGAAKLAESVRFYFTNRRIIYIMGILRDKEYEEIIRETCSYAQQIFTVSTQGERGLSAYALAGEVRRYHENVTAADSVEEAVELSLLLADKDTVVIAFGSLSYLGKFISAVEKKDHIGRDSHGK